MENQHRLVKGYRDLNQKEIDFMNEIKEISIKVGQLFSKVEESISFENNPDRMPGQDDELIIESQRWASIAKIDLQKGFMALARAIAKPTTF